MFACELLVKLIFLLRTIKFKQIFKKMSKQIHISLALVSFALIAFQIVLMQILSITQWHHFAFMIISLALLGFGAAGTLISLYKNWFVKHKNLLLPGSMLSAGFFIVVSVPLSQLEIFRFDTYLVFADTQHISKLVFTYILLFIPFFTGALAVGLIFVSYSKEIGKLYFSNLLGSGFGGLGALVLLWTFDPNILPLFISLFPLLGGITLINKSNKLLVIPLGIICIITFFYSFFIPRDLHISQYKSLSKTLDLPNAEIKIEKNSPYGFMQVVESDALRYAPGLSLNFRGEIPVRKAIFNNGNWVGPILSSATKDTSLVLDYTTGALAYNLTRVDDILILDAGTGEDVVHAINHNAGSVTAVEPNSALNSLLLKELAGDTDSTYYKNNIKLIELYPRTFLQADTNSYDIIKLPMLGAFGGTSGMQAIREEYLLTVESIELIFEKLKPKGFVSVTSWMDYPYRNPLRILSVILEALNKKGIAKPSEHIISIRSWNTISFFVKKNELDSLDINAARKFCDDMNFDPVILPGITDEERSKYNQLQDYDFFRYIDILLSGQSDKFISDYTFRLTPPTDNKPYFSQFLRWNNLIEIEKYFGSRSIPFFELGYLIVILTLIQIVVISFILIILPLFKIGWKGENKLRTILYFTGLGIGYMFIEIVLIQKFILYFGSPILSASAVISFMLICSGIGSYFSSYIKSLPKNLLIVTGGIVIFLLLYAFILDPVLNKTIQLSIFTKALIAFVVIGIPAFIMGFPFPLGIKKLDETNKLQIPWAWGINGCFSVISTALATVVAVELGFTAVFLFAGLAYVLVFGVSLRG